MEFYVFALEFRVLRGFPLISWSGSFVSGVVREILSSTPSVSLVSVSPLFIEGRVVLSGLVERDRAGKLRFRYQSVNPASRISFRFTVSCDGNPPLNIISSRVSEVGEKRGLTLESISLEALRLPKDPLGVSGERFQVTIDFNPTILMFRSWPILYPSPARIIYSTAKTASQIAGVDLRKVAYKLVRRVELLEDRTRVERYTIGRKNGKERIVKAFRGKAVLAVYGRETMELLAALLSVAEKVNIGKSRGIGFGQIKITKIDKV